MPRLPKCPSPALIARRIARLAALCSMAAGGIAACRTGGRSGEGIETGAVNTDSAARDSARGASADSARAARSGPLHLASLMIGRRLGPENRISEPTLRFATGDTMFVSVATEGKPDSNATLLAKWTFPTGKVRDSASTTIQTKPGELTEVHAAPPKNGWTIGSYLITIYLGGDSVDAKTVAVQK